MSALTAEIVPVHTVGSGDRDRMYELLQGTYDHTARDRFEKDLDSKHDVILLRDQEGLLQGFSTLRNLVVEVDGQRRHAVYSGDTVIARAHWGQRVLGRAFLGYLFRQRLKRPFQPLYWMLISKGFKTYLLMANNFREHWPRHERAMPSEVVRLRDSLAHELFGRDYDGETGVVRFAEPMGQLRPGIADVTAELRQKHPRVAFFSQQNPGWAQGEELVCLARMSWKMPFYYTIKALRKLGVRQTLGRSR